MNSPANPTKYICRTLTANLAPFHNDMPLKWLGGIYIQQASKLIIYLAS